MLDRALWTGTREMLDTRLHLTPHNQVQVVALLLKRPFPVSKIQGDKDEQRCAGYPECLSPDSSRLRKDHGPREPSSEVPAGLWVLPTPTGTPG